MDLMSPLLFYALAALLPQTSGRASQKLKTEFNKLIYKNQRELYDVNIVTKLNETSKISKVSDLQSVFMDPTCKECHNCMEQTIKGHKIHFYTNAESKINDVPNKIGNPEESTTYRNKRNLDVDSDLKLVKKMSKKSKIKKNMSKKSYLVTKYSDEGKIYALKVKETITPLISSQLNQTKPSVSKCKVYRVKESFTCNSPDADLILSETKRKINKTRTDKEKRETNVSVEKKENNSTPFPLIIKHHVEDSQASENFMPSIEEMY